jgi:hypothetical protein
MRRDPESSDALGEQPLVAGAIAGRRDRILPRVAGEVAQRAGGGKR